MVQIISMFLPILWVCFTEVCESQPVQSTRTSEDPWLDPRVWPETFIDEDMPFIEFSCGAYLKTGEWLSWRKKEDDDRDLSLVKQQSDGYRTLKLLWPLTSLKNKTVYCRKRYKTDKVINDTQSKSITIHHSFKNNIYSYIKDADWGPWLLPTDGTFVPEGKRIKFTSYAHLDKTGNLTCYQKKDSTEFKLGMIEQENEYSYVKITLQKALEPSDNGSVIYCIAHTLIKSKWEIKISNNTQITFERQIEALEPYVTVEPSTDVVFFDEGDDFEFVCGGSVSDDVRRLTWYLQTPYLCKVAPPGQYFYKSTNENRLSLRMNVLDHENLLYCAQEFTFELRNGTETRSRTITLLHRQQCNASDRPRVVPSTFVDEHKSCIQITCYAYLKPGELLSWYQSELHKSAGALLRMIQLQDPKTKEGEWTVLTLNKTLEPTDNGSEIYCAQQSVRADGSFSDVKQPDRISITLKREIPSLERPFIRVEPNTQSVSFDVNTTLRLTCGGSKPVDGRTYTWFKKELESSLTELKDQKYDASTNLNVLYLSLNESHHLNKLFCVQGFLSYIRHTDGSLHPKSYGELVISDITTLIQRDKYEQYCSSSGNTHLLLSVAIPLALLSLVAVAAACWALRRRRAAPPAPSAPALPATAPRDNADDIYGDYVNVSRTASPQVTYAVLDLPRSAVAARAPPAPDQALYAEIAKASPQVTYATLDLPKATRAQPAPEPSLYAEIARVSKPKQ